MKTIAAIFFPIVVVALMIMLLTGCANKQVLNKQTIFGFQAHTPGPNGSTFAVQLGLIRNEYFSNPTTTNPIYAAPFNSAVQANVAAFNQSGNESFGTYQLPTNAYVQPKVDTSIPETPAK